MTQINKENTPLVSCLCITDGRPECLELSIQCFLKQSYPNRELVVVYNPEDNESKAVLHKYEDLDVRAIAVGRGDDVSLGSIRNMAIDYALGEYVCTWDDDDWFHIDRIEVQLNSLLRSKKTASILSRILIFDKYDQAAYLATERLWENTVLFNKSVVSDHGICYPERNRGEDYFFVNELIKANLVYPLLEPRLYIYFVNGLNVSDREHFERFYIDSQKLDQEASSLTEAALYQTLPPELASIKLDDQRFLNGLCYVEAARERH